MIYRYFSPLRPISPGTFPNTETLIKIHNYDSRKFVENIGCEVWGYIDYSEPLTKGQINDYELIEEAKR
jgi:hypothetical protein